MIVIKKKVNFLLILQRAEFLLLLILRTTWFGELFWIFFLHVLIIYIFYLVSVAIYIFKKKIFINNNLAITTLLVINCFNLLFKFSVNTPLLSRLMYLQLKVISDILKPKLLLLIKLIEFMQCTAIRR